MEDAYREVEMLEVLLAVSTINENLDRGRKKKEKCLRETVLQSSLQRQEIRHAQKRGYDDVLFSSDQSFEDTDSDDKEHRMKKPQLTQPDCLQHAT